MAKIFVVGIGPGGYEDMTPRARKAIEAADVVIGYSTYIKLIERYFPGKELVSSEMTHEAERCRHVLERAAQGQNVALISSGDSGIYGMAGIMLEIVGQSSVKAEVEVIPGITAAAAAAAVLGAPIMHDFAVISLSDRLTPWELICKRLECASQADFVICLYNPKSRGRTEHINIAREIMLKYKKGSTPAGIVRNAGREEQSSTVTTLDSLLDHEIDMFTVIIIGNSQTYEKDGRIITPRGYNIDS